MLYHIVEENYLNERDVFQESVTAYSLKHVALIGVNHNCQLGRLYNRGIFITQMGN